MDFDRLLSHLPVERWRRPAPLVSVVRLFGLIGRPGPARAGLSLAGLAGTLERAFAPRRLAAVALAINSPGGSPVQSGLIARRIRALADEKKVPVLAFCEDVAASGGYWLACAADEIYADENSILGSIGVITAGFGLHEMIGRLGIERRVHAIGERKAMLDPFRPEDPDDVVRLTALQAEMHANFTALVRGRRGERLKGEDRDLFNGDIWTGRRAVELGLADGLGDLRGVLRARFGDKVRLRVANAEYGWLRRRLGFTLGTTAWPEAALAALEDRVSWARYGL